MDLGYNKEIDLSEVTFPEGFIFEKTEKTLCLKSRWRKKIVVTSAGIEIITYTQSLFTGKEENLKSFFIEKDNISDFSIKTYCISGRSSDSGITLYKIILTLKNSKKIELFENERLKTKLVAFFLIQEFSKILNLPLRNSSQNKDNLDAPNFCNFDVIQNDSQNLIIKRDSKLTYTYDNVIRLIYVNLFVLACLIALILLSFYGIQNRLASGLPFNWLSASIGYSFFVFLVMICLSILHTYYNGYYKGEGQGVYLSINPFQISISNAGQTNTKKIEIDKNIMIEITQVISLVNANENLNNNFEVVLSKTNDYNLKQSKIILVDEITQSEAEYLVKKIFYLANQNNKAKLVFNNHIKIKFKFYKFIVFILFGIFCSFILSYIIYALAKATL